MKFDREYFDAGLNRMGTDCIKWDMIRRQHGDDILPMWVADMDFPSPPEIAQEMLVRAAHPTYGYTEETEEDWQAPIDFWQRRHGVSLKKEDMLMLPCVVTGMRVALKACTEPGDGVVIMPPVYGPFAASVKVTGRKCVPCPLLHDEHNYYTMDYDAIDQALAQGAKAVMLCSPHNPIGRAWTEEELRRLTEITAKHGVTLISDEIHADFVYDGRKHVSVLKLAKDNVIMLCAASKTFNIAGLQQSLCICENKDLMAKLRDETEAGGVRSGNIFAMVGTRAAYRYGDAWLDGLLGYLQGNRDELELAVAELLPSTTLTRLEATYLCWLDVRAYGLTDEEIKERCIKAGVFFNDGTFFGKEGSGFLRINIACPRRYLREGIQRLKKALEG